MGVRSMEEKLFVPGSELQSWFSVSAAKLDKKRLLQLPSPESMVEHCLAIANAEKGGSPEVAAAESIKNLERAMVLKEEGNRLFKEGDVKAARNVYSQSLLMYPLRPEDSASAKEYSVILANRSAALDAGRLFEAAVQDIDYAFKYGYPKELQFKIYKRLGHCLLRLKQYAKSKEEFTKCLDMIGKSDMNSKLRDKTRFSIKKQMTVFNVVKELRNESLEKPGYELTGGASKDLSAASSLVEISDNKLVAVEELCVENVLLKETPAAAILFDDAVDKVCPHTLVRMAAPVPCRFGSEASFASEEARAEAEGSYHAHEWKVARRLREAGLAPVGRLALRLVTSETEEKKNTAAFDLIDLDKKTTDKEKFSASLLSGFLVKVLRVTGYLKGKGDKLDGSEEKSAAARLYRAVIVAVRHSMPMSLLDANQISKGGEVLGKEIFPATEFAVGLFPSLSTLRAASKRGNKDDDEPDAFWFFQNDKIIMQVNKAAKKGAHLKLVSAVDTEGGVERLEVINDMITFRCSKDSCEVGFPLKENTKEKVIVCPIKECGKETNVWLKLKRIQDLKKLRREQVTKNVEKGEWREVIENLRFLIAEWEKIVRRPYKEFANLERELRSTILLDALQKDRDWMAAHV